MPKLPIVSGTDVMKVADKLGFEFKRQSGSHLIFKKADKLLVIPNHKQLKTGTLLQILKVLEIDRETFASMLKR